MHNLTFFDNLIIGAIIIFLFHRINISNAEFNFLSIIGVSPN